LGRFKKFGVVFALLVAMLVVAVPVEAGATTATAPVPVTLHAKFRGTLSGKATAHIAANWQGRVHVTGLAVGTYRFHLGVTRNFYDKDHNIVGSSSNDFQICTFKVKAVGGVGHCGGTRKNAPWTYEPGDIVSAEIFGTQNLMISEPMS